MNTSTDYWNDINSLIKDIVEREKLFLIIKNTAF